MVDLEALKQKLSRCDEWKCSAQLHRDELRALIAELEQLRAGEPKWIACVDRMPKRERSVLIIGHDWPAAVVADLTVDMADGEPLCFSDKTGGGSTYWLDDVTHWMPLPSPPEAVKP